MVWGKADCTRCLECEASLVVTGVSFERRPIREVFVGKWLDDPKADQDLLRKVAATYVLKRGMPVVQVGRDCYSCEEALVLLKGGGA